MRFDFFCKAALEFLLKTGRQPDILHCHDWSTAHVAKSFWEDYQPYGLYKPKVRQLVTQMKVLSVSVRCGACVFASTCGQVTSALCGIVKLIYSMHNTLNFAKLLQVAFNSPLSPGLYRPVCCDASHALQVVFTIHNMNYGQKKITEAAEWSQKFTTVSPTYAFEIGGHPAIAGVPL